MVNGIMNFFWLVLGGFATAVGWFGFSLLMLCSIVGIPWAKASFNIGLLALWPFGAEVFDREEIVGEKDIGTGSLGFLGNILWYIFAGLWLGLAHILCGIILCVTLIGIPFGLQHFKLARISIFPIGKTILRKNY